MTADEIIAEAAQLPLLDAAYAIWRQNSAFIRELEMASPRDLSDRRDALAYGQHLKAEDDLARTGAPASANFQRVKRAHPHADDAAVTAAILAAIAFDDDCMKHFVWGDDFWIASFAPSTAPSWTIPTTSKPPTAMPATM